MKILVIGDACKDIYVYGRSVRLCPDAPVPVFIPQNRVENGGMAANVQRNIISLGAECDIISNQEYIEKRRYVDAKTNHMFLRVDSNEEKTDRVHRHQLKNLQSYDAVVISDYDKGFLTEGDIEWVCENHGLVFLDTKKKLGKWCAGSRFIKINEVEYDNSKGFIGENKILLEEKLVVTLSSNGCRYMNKHYDVAPVNIKDSSGAGDTFLAGFVVEYLKARDIEQALQCANSCATKVVQQKGVTEVGEL